ncbi:hypothetical protein RB195_008783 [Necator americanus]|uniref:Calponin-homology (CH) domain-containing protein n=1 Tax=Necator americanus TaxID=51031 RepID=A0ABR1CTN5_NECAM
MCPEISLSPVKWRRRSWRTMLAASRREQITPSVPVSARVQELEKLGSIGNEDTRSVKEMLQRILDMLSAQHNSQEKNENEVSNANEELQATTSELEEIRLVLLVTERKCATFQKKNDRLEAELEMTRRQLQYIRNETLGRRRHHTCGKSSKLSQSFDAGALSCDSSFIKGDEKSVVIELQEKVAVLNKEVQKRDVIIENERIAHKAQLKDFIAAVKAADRCREEVQMEMTKLVDICRNVNSPDEALWFGIMQKFERSSKRNALLAWAQSNLTAYPSISVSNFTSDWSDGRAFCALVHHFRQDMVERIMLLQRDECPQLAVELGAKLNVQIDPELFIGPKPDYRRVMAIVFNLYKRLELTEQTDQEC